MTTGAKGIPLFENFIEPIAMRALSPTSLSSVGGPRRGSSRGYRPFLTRSSTDLLKKLPRFLVPGFADHRGER